MGLSKICEDVWEVNATLFVGLGIYASARMTVIRLADGRLIIHSPVGLYKDTIEELKTLGDVAYIVAPNRYHHMFVPGAAEAFPDAEIWGSPGLIKKREDIAFDGVLTIDDHPWGQEFQAQLIGGAPEMSEVVFFHEASASLIATDLFWNSHEGVSWHAKLYLQFNGAWKKPGQSYLWRFLAKDKAAFGQSATDILKWPLQRAIPAHGRVLDSESAKSDFIQAIQWMLNQQKRLELQ